MLTFLIVSSLCVMVLTWILAACSDEFDGAETFVIGLVVGGRWFVFLGLIFVIVKVVTL